MKKLCLLLFATLCFKQISGVSEEIQELMDNLHKTCVAESGAAEDAIVNARKGNFAEDQNFKCYFKCLSDQMGCFTDDGRIDPDAVVALMPPEVVDAMEPVIRSCDLVGSDLCDTAWKVNKCYYEKKPELYMLP